MTKFEVKPLSIIETTEWERLIKIQKRKIMPQFVDIIVLHPDLPRILRHGGWQDCPNYVALHATLEGLDYIARLALLSDVQILSSVEGKYTQNDIQDWLMRGYERPPFLKGGDLAMASSQLEYAIKDGISRVINK